ncbi:MAG: hypothetical protein P4L26_09240 [Terracidiphilus sp.]|nr:hypothetical protein [Terracidiphilus sp.]
MTTETYHRTLSEQTTQGYRPLTGAGHARGAELKTSVYACIGIALGIVAGTMLASGPWGRTNPNPSRQTAQVSAPVSGPAQPTTAQVAAPKGSDGTSGLPQVAAASLPQLAAAALPRLSSAEKPAGVATTVALTGTLVHEHRAVRRRALGRRHGHLRHRLHLPLKPTVRAEQAAADVPENFVFTVEGSMTVSSYDSPAATIETYEGESFTLDRSASDTTSVSWLEYPSDLHYRCDQSGSCTLLHAGAVVSNARRTR